MTLINNKVINEWEIYSAEQFRKEFLVREKREDTECDEDFIMRHLQLDDRIFRVTFNKDPKGNAYAEFWRIQEIQL